MGYQRALPPHDGGGSAYATSEGHNRGQKDEPDDDPIEETWYRCPYCAATEWRDEEECREHMRGCRVSMFAHD